MEKLPELSDEVQEIITSRSNWKVRNGNTVLAIIFFLFAIVAVIVPYPQVINTTLQINSQNAPKPIITKTSGKLVRIMVAEGSMVSKDQPIAYMQSTADHGSVLALLVLLKKSDTDANINLESDLPPVKTNDLGELQSDYEIFYNAYLTYKLTSRNGLFQKQQTILSNDLNNLRKKKQEQQALHDVYTEDLKLAEDNFKAHAKLAEQKVETRAEFNQEQSKYLAKKAQSLMNNVEVIAADNEIKGKEREIFELINVANESRVKFEQQKHTLISKIEKWKATFVLVAPQKGKLEYAGLIQPQAEFNIGAPVFYINPISSVYIGELKIPQENGGSVKIGQKVVIKLKEYPYQDFGILLGKVSYISNVPTGDNVFLARVTLLNQHLTDNNVKLYLKNGLVADAEIVIGHKSLVNSLINRVRASAY